MRLTVLAIALLSGLFSYSNEESLKWDTIFYKTITLKENNTWEFDVEEDLLFVLVKSKGVKVAGKNYEVGLISPKGDTSNVIWASDKESSFPKYDFKGPNTFRTSYQMKPVEPGKWTVFVNTKKPAAGTLTVFLKSAKK